MMIFNWAQRKLNQNGVGKAVSPMKDGLVSRNVEMSEAVSFPDKTLLDEVTLADIWKDGILSIGTFGFHHEDVDIMKEQEQGEVPHPFMAFKQEVPENMKSDISATIPDNRDIDIEASDAPLLQFPEVTNMIIEVEAEKKRITLADLFKEETVTTVIPETVADKPVVEAHKKPVYREKGRLSFGKKHKDKGEDSQTIRKVQRVMSKMLKKKIHPDIEGKILEKDVAEKPPKMATDTFYATPKTRNLPKGGRIDLLLCFKIPPTLE
ncbi:hypothetical protein ACHQM5_011953 [Ranunculus cassubicifolius]